MKETKLKGHGSTFDEMPLNHTKS